MPLKQIKIVFVLLFLLFLLKGIALSLLIPLFQNPDEQMHYASIQYLAEPKGKTWGITKRPRDAEKGTDISTFHFSEEIIQSAKIAQFDEVKSQNENTQTFSKSTSGLNENEIVDSNWKHYIDTYPPRTSGARSFYYPTASYLEHALSNESTLIRTFSMRLLSVIFGAFVVLLAYFTAKKIGFSQHHSLLVATIIAFQPMFSASAAQINIDIALIFSFSLFLYAGASFLHSLDRHCSQTTLRWALLAVSAAILGILSKGPGIVLIVALFPLFVWGAYQRFQIPKKQFLLWLTIVTIILIGLVLLIVPKNYLVSITNSTALSKFHSPTESIGEYLHKTLGQKELRDTARSYWGNFGWLDNAIPGWMLSIIRIIEAVGFFGVFWYLLTPVLPTRLIPAPMRNNDQPDWLPRRQYIIFFLGMIIALQCAIRFYDWRIFDNTGQILIGQPGRYFLPNLVGHLVIVVTGIGFLVRQEKYFMFTLKILALAMILLQWYAIIDIILPRYYL